MKKETYETPEIMVIEIGQGQILSGSGPGMQTEPLEEEEGDFEW